MFFTLEEIILKSKYFGVVVIKNKTTFKHYEGNTHIITILKLHNGRSINQRILTQSYKFTDNCNILIILAADISIVSKSEGMCV